MPIYGPTGADVFLENVKNVQQGMRDIGMIGTTALQTGELVGKVAENKGKMLAEQLKFTQSIVDSQYDGDWSYFLSDSDGNREMGKSILRGLYGDKLSDEQVWGMPPSDRPSLKKRNEEFSKFLDQKIEGIIGGQTIEQMLKQDMTEAAETLRKMQSLQTVSVQSEGGPEQENRVQRDATDPRMYGGIPSVQGRGNMTAQVGINVPITTREPLQRGGPSTTFGAENLINPNLTTDELTVGIRTPAQGTPNRKFYDATNPKGTVLSDMVFKARTLWQKYNEEAKRLTPAQRGGQSPENWAKMRATEEALGVSTADELEYMNAINSGKSEKELTNTRFAQRAAELGVTPTELRQLRGPDFQGQLTGELVAPVNPVSRFLTSYSEGAGAAYETAETETAETETATNPPPPETQAGQTQFSGISAQTVRSGGFATSPKAALITGSQEALVKQAAAKKQEDIRTAYSNLKAVSESGKAVTEEKASAAKAVEEAVVQSSPTPSQTKAEVEVLKKEESVPKDREAMIIGIINGLIDKNEVSPKDKRLYESFQAKTLSRRGSGIKQSMAKSPKWRVFQTEQQQELIDLLSTGDGAVISRSTLPEEKAEWARTTLNEIMSQSPLLAAASTQVGGYDSLAAAYSGKDVIAKKAADQTEKFQNAQIVKWAEDTLLEGKKIKQTAKQIELLARNAKTSEDQVELQKNMLALDAVKTLLTSDSDERNAILERWFKEQDIYIRWGNLKLGRDTLTASTAQSKAPVERGTEDVQASMQYKTATAYMDDFEAQVKKLKGKALRQYVERAVNNSSGLSNALQTIAAASGGNTEYKAEVGLKDLVLKIEGGTEDLTGDEVWNLLLTYAPIGFNKRNLRLMSGQFNMEAGGTQTATPTPASQASPTAEQRKADYMIQGFK